MDQLLFSRIKRPEETARLESLSPQKFGRSAYAQLSYTPSKLAGTVLYKEVSQMKKVEENGSKIRQFQSINKILKDKLKHQQAQKEGIELSLNQQIIMYKKMITEMEQQLEQRIKDLQILFNEQIHRIITDKEEEAKYVQSEKQMLENRLFQLENIIAEMREEINLRDATIEKKNQELQTMTEKFNVATQKGNQMEKRFKDSGQQTQKAFQDLNKKLQDQEMQFKNQCQKLQLQRRNQIQNLQNMHRIQMQKNEQKRKNEMMLKQQELKDLSANLEQQTKRLNQKINKKDDYIKNVSKQLSDEKERIINVTKQYMGEITALKNENRKMEEDCRLMNHSLHLQSQDFKKAQAAAGQNISYLERELANIKMELNKTQDAFLQQRQRFFREKDDMKQQLIILRKNTQGNSRLMDQNSFLCRQVKNLKELLVESSLEMERCKDEFVRLATEKDTLVIKLRELDVQNETLHRHGFERQQEAKTWRESYYKYRR